MVQTISRDEVKTGLDAGTLTLVDALPESYYHQQHLPGAINLVADDVDTHAAQLLPDKNAPIVTYCSNPACANRPTRHQAGEPRLHQRPQVRRRHPGLD